jgi:hypothetical protein
MPEAAVEKNPPAAVHRAALREELGVAGQGLQLADHAADPGRAVVLGLLLHAGDGQVPALGDQLGDLGDLAARQGLAEGPQPSRQTQRADAVADHDLAGLEPLQRQTVDLVAGQPGDGQLVSGRDELLAVRLVR